MALEGPIYIELFRVLSGMGYYKGMGYPSFPSASGVLHGTCTLPSEAYPLYIAFMNNIPFVHRALLGHLGPYRAFSDPLGPYRAQGPHSHVDRPLEGTCQGCIGTYRAP